MSDSYEATGTLREIGELKLVGASGKPKRDLIVEIGGKWPQLVSFELYGDAVDKIIPTVAVGDIVAVKFDLRGRRYVKEGGKVNYFNSLSAWRVEVKQRATSAGDGTSF